MNRNERLEAIRSRTEPFDIVVIGGGATGAGCALDAASRGLSVLLLEQADFGKGTSGRSTKLIHGGVRYLEQGNISLVREALAERKLLIDLAPDFVVSQPFIVPCYGWFRKLYYGAGLKVYDALSGDRSLGRTELLSADATLESLRGLNPDGLSGGVRYLDARFDDAGFLFAIVSEAAEQGAEVLNYAEVEEITPGKTIQSKFRDRTNSMVLEVRSKAVINAAGIFADRVDSLATGRQSSQLTFSQGIHLVFEPDFLPGPNALMIPRTSDGRVLFAIPWLGKLLVGTTDTPVGEPKLEPSALQSEIDFVLDACAGYLERAPTREDIRSVFAGIRPLVGRGREKRTSRISREHLVESPAPGMVTVRGGKWTTYRRMAKDAVDAAVETAGLKANHSRSDEIEIRDRCREVAGELMSGDPGLAEPIVTGSSVTKADVTAAVRSGMVVKLEDALARRNRLLFLDARMAAEAAVPAAEILAIELGWPEGQKEEEIREFRELAGNYLPRSV